MLSLREMFFVSTASAILFTAAPQVAHKQSEAGSAIPKECASADFAKLGRPVIFRADNGLSYGISAGSGKFTFGGPVLLYFWIINTSKKTGALQVCALDLFPNYTFTIHDATGQRILSRKEEKDTRTYPPCLRNYMVEMPAHSCSKPRAGTDLAQFYELPPGQYVVRFLDGSRFAAKFTPAGTTDGVPITIEPK